MRRPTGVLVLLLGFASLLFAAHERTEDLAQARGKLLELLPAALQLVHHHPVLPVQEGQAIIVIEVCGVRFAPAAEKTG
jgi:hypothetical protein